MPQNNQTQQRRHNRRTRRATQAIPPQPMLQTQGEPLMDYPKPVHKFHPKYHYPDCAPPIATEDNDCEFCIPFRLLDEDIQRVRADRKEGLADRHRNLWQGMRNGELIIDDVHNGYNDTRPEMKNRKQHVELRNKWNDMLRKRIKEVDDFFAQQNCQPMELDLSTDNVNPDDSMDLDSNNSDIRDKPKRNNSMVIQNDGFEITLEWDSEGIVFDH